MPDLIGIFMDKQDIPSFMNDSKWGHRFWGFVMTVSQNVTHVYSTL